MKFGKKLGLLFWFCTISIVIFTAGVFYKEISSTAHITAGTHLTDIASSISFLIDTDAHSRIKSPTDEKGRDYKLIRSKLERFREANPKIRHIYTIVRAAKSNRLNYVIDVGVNPSLIAHVGCPLNITDYPEIQHAFDKPIVDPVVRQDKWGSWISAYAPVKSGNTTVTIVGFDMSAKEAIKEEKHLQFIVGLMVGIGIILSTVLGFVIDAKISKPINQLTVATQLIADGNLDHVISIDSKDEIGKMAESLNRMTQSLRESQTSLLQRANTDGLTGLYNHRYFQDRLNQELKRALRYSRPLSLMMIDLDGFKAVNDSLGHLAGDTILRNFSKILTSEVREIDVAARYGGDEFAVILPETSLEEALRLAESVRAAVDHSPHLMEESLTTNGDKSDNKKDWKITLSIGVAECPAHTRQRDSLVSAADIAMYHAKHVSQNAVCSYDRVPGAGGTMDPCRIYTFLQSASVSTIAALAAAVDAKDHYTHGHSESVARYAVGIATELRLTSEEKFNVRIAALLHDVGKIGMPDTLLNNPGKLDTYERELIRNHPSVGERIVKQVPQLQKILPGILYHHEKYNGTGYPCGLSGKKIPLIARIICVADSFDAMTSNRPYRSAMSTAQALAELRDNVGTQFDTDCVDALIRWIQSAELQVA
ncbi:MAG: diguanylate cyclase [Armatimonadota bacterium]